MAFNDQTVLCQVMDGWEQVLQTGLKCTGLKGYYSTHHTILEHHLHEHEPFCANSSLRSCRVRVSVNQSCL